MKNTRLQLYLGMRGVLVLVLLMIGLQGFAQQPVTGVVKDSTDGQTMPGVGVLIKGKSVGTVTDFEGKFSINASPEDILLFSYLGYNTSEIKVGSQTNITISLSANDQLGDVVVVGYGEVDKKDLTGAVDRVTSEDFNKGILVSPKQLIAAKVPGVTVQTDGSPRGNSEVRIRGGSTFGGNSDPLYIIDGVPMTKNAGHGPGAQDPLSFINPNDIEEITVLKDASAAAIYGVQGASGVILITTKSGSAGDLKVSYSGQYGVSVRQASPPMLSTADFVTAVGLKAPRNLADLGNADTDWVDEVTRLASSTNHSVSASWGSKVNSVRVSLGYLDAKGILLTDRTQRITPSVKYTHKFLNNDLKITATYNGGYNRDRLAPNVMSTALTYAPSQPVYAEDATNGGFFEWGDDLAPTNPVSSLEQSFNQNRAARHFGGLTFDYKLPFLEGLSLKGNLGYDRMTSRVQSVTLPTLKPDNRVDAGFLSFEKGMTETKTSEVFINYKKQFNLDHKVDIVLGHSYQDFRGEYPRYERLGGVTYDQLGITDPLEYKDDSYFNTDNELLQFVNDSDPGRVVVYRLASLYGRLNYSLKGKYLFTATARYDGSSRFSPENQFNMFPSVAFAWRLIDESFMEPLDDVFSELKLRVGYGVVGNQNISREFGYVDLYSLGNGTAQYILGNDTVRMLRPQGANPNIQWEETTSLNFGVDFGLFNGRITGAIDYYRKQTTDLLYKVTWPIGPLTTFTEFANIAAFNVNGIELSLNGKIMDKPGGLKWDMNFNVSHYMDEITSLDFSNDPSFIGYEDENSGISGDVGNNIQIIRLGQRINTFFVYEHMMDANGNPRTDGTDYNGDGIANNADIFRDQNGDGEINEDDLITYNTSTPDLTIGFTNNMSYKKWSLAMTWRGQIGGHIYNNIQAEHGYYEGLNDNFAPRNIHEVAFTNDFNVRNIEMLKSSIWVQDASFLKLDNITVGYQFDIVKKYKASAFFTGSNLVVITPYEGSDPEVGLKGIDNNPYPRSRTFILGVNVNF